MTSLSRRGLLGLFAGTAVAQVMPALPARPDYIRDPAAFARDRMPFDAEALLDTSIRDLYRSPAYRAFVQDYVRELMTGTAVALHPFDGVPQIVAREDWIV